MDRKSFKALQKEWYTKLKESGFVDIEDSKGGLKIYSQKLAAKNSQTMSNRWLATREYYYQAEHFANNYKEFESELHQSIWTYHSGGLGSREIVTALSKVKIKTNRTTVCRIIKYYAEKMDKLYMIELLRKNGGLI
jgi:hypothetical protein